MKSNIIRRRQKNKQHFKSCIWAQHSLQVFKWRWIC